MRVTFYDEDTFHAFVKTIREEYFSEPFELFGQQVMIHRISAGLDMRHGGYVDLDIVQVI